MDAYQPDDASAGGKSAISQSAHRMYDCVELYLPKRLAYLSGLYDYLHRRLKERTGESARAFALDGFSIYEVDGVWRDQTTDEVPVSDERTLVIRVLLQCDDSDPDSLPRRINELAQDLASLAPDENAILISHHRQSAFTYYPDRGVKSRFVPS